MAQITGRQKSEAKRMIVISNPSVCHYCKSKGLTESDKFCPNCGFPQRGSQALMKNFIWNINPDMFSFGPFQLKWLTVLLVVGVLVGRKLLAYMFKKEGANPGEVGSVFNFTLVGAILGARLFYVATSADITRITADI